MSAVYFIPVNAHHPLSEISQSAGRLIARLVSDEKLSLNDYIPLKVHFGEKGNKTYIDSGNYEGIIRFLADRKVESAFIETNALYRGSRQNRTDHLNLAREHGFTQLPVVIADGEYGDDYTEVSIGKKRFTSCKIGRSIAECGQIVVLSHFKGHMIAGFGGAIKQLAMGCASRGGKLAQHANAVPGVKKKKCDACGACAAFCPVEAIYLQPKAQIDPAKCIGCASCIAVCPSAAITNSWWASLGRAFLERMAEYAFAAHNQKNNIYINFALNITRGCDCEGKAMKPVHPDLGLVASIDPVAADQACLDLLSRRRGRKVFWRGRHVLKYGEQIGLGSRNYTLVQMDENGK